MNNGNSANPGIVHISQYLPETVLTNRELAEQFDIKEEFMTEKLGIRQRHIAGPEESVADMAVSAGQELLDSIPLSFDDIGLLVLCTQNPDYRLPTTSCLVQERLGLLTSTASFDINQGCSGYIYGLSTVRAIMQVEEIENAVLITSEAYSKVMDDDSRNVRPIFGDGATATLISNGGEGQIGKCSFGTDGSGAQDLIVKGGGSRHPKLDIVGEGALHMNGRAIFNFMMNRVPVDVTACLKKNALEIGDIDFFVFHQASKYMIESLSKAMKLPPEKVVIDLAETGNTVCSTLPMAILGMGGPKALAGKTILLSGFGVGLSWGSTVLRFKH